MDPVTNNKLKVPESMGKMPEMHINAAINPLIFRIRSSDRERKRLAISLMVDFEKKVTKLVNSFFKFKQLSDSAASEEYLLKLDGLWKEFLRNNHKKYQVANCSNFFATRVMFFMGDKDANEKLLEQIKKDGVDE